MSHIIGIDLGGTTVKFAILSDAGEILNKWTIATNTLDQGKYIIPSIIYSLKEHMKVYHLTESDFVGIGMGSPGKVDKEKGTVVGAYNLNWKEIQYVKEQFNTAFQLPFFIDNDANTATLGEQWKGAGHGKSDVVMLTLGTGVGGGIVANGQLVSGFSGAAGEVGHITVETSESMLCTCGKHGCLETVASATGILNLARRFAEHYEGNSTIKEKIDNGDKIFAKTIFQEAKKGDSLSNQIVEDFARYLGLACSHVANTLNPAIIVIGGGVSAAGNFLLEKVNRYYYKYTFSQIRDVTKVVLAELGNESGVIGAAQLVRMQMTN